MSTNVSPFPVDQVGETGRLASGVALERFLTRWLISHGINGLLHGTIFVLAILLVLGEHPPGHLRVIITVALTVLATALAGGYAEFIEAQIHERRQLVEVEREKVNQHVGSVLVTAIPPIGIFALSWLGFFGIQAAFTLSQWVSVALFGACGYLSRRVIGSSMTEGAVGALIAVIVGGAIVWLKTLAH